MATFNGENYVSQQIKSILSQVSVEVRLIISDDFSTDNTLKIIKSISDDRISILDNNTQFRSAALNFFSLIMSISNSNFDYVALADQDDIWFSEKLSKGISKLSKFNASAYSSSFYIYYTEKLIKYGHKPDNQSERDFVFQSSGPGNTFILTKELVLDFKSQFNKFKNIESVLFHDWFIYAFSRANNYKWVIDKDAYILYRQHNFNLLGANDNLFSKLKRVFPNNWKWYKQQARYIYNTFNLDSDIVLNEIFNHKVSFFKLWKYKYTLRSKNLDSYVLIVMINFKNI